MNTTNERHTPETDALQAQVWKPNWAAHARRLERERDEARAIAKYWQEQYGHSNPEHEWQALPWDKEGGPQ